MKSLDATECFVGKKFTNMILRSDNSVPAGLLLRAPGEWAETLSLEVCVDAGSYIFHSEPLTRLGGLDLRLFTVEGLQENISNICYQ